jgi:hypothetical protein
MAYSVSVTRTADWVPKTSEITYIYEIVETDAGAASDEYILGLHRPVPKVGTITLFTATVISGTGPGTIAPKAGLVTGWSANSQNEVFTRSAAAHHNDQDVVRYSSKDGKLYIRSVCSDTTADHVVHTRITIRAGHGG